MLSKIIFGSLLLCILTACEQGDSFAEIKTKFLAKTDINLSNATIQKQMDSLKVSLLDIYNYCQKQPNFEYKSKFIACIYGKVDNYLQEENTAYWKGVLYDLKRFNEVIYTFKEPQHKTFLDVGSGNGEKPYAALCLGFEKSYGLEYSKNLVEISRHALQDFIQKQKIDIIHGDALQVSPEIYEKTDVIYLFSPIKDNKRMAELTNKIMKNMKNGALLLEMRFVYAKELQKKTGLLFPDLTDIVVKKENDKFYYAEYADKRKTWILLK